VGGKGAPERVRRGGGKGSEGASNQFGRDEGGEEAFYLYSHQRGDFALETRNGALEGGARGVTALHRAREEGVQDLE
jgi:hypothetical protein